MTMTQAAATPAMLAKRLPGALRAFFRRYPPPQAQIQALVPNLSDIVSPQALANYPDPPTQSPFEPRKDHRTGKWYGPIFGLRKQAHLVALARQNNVEELLPYTIKKTGERARKREEHGLRVKGTGIGQQVKGHQWERMLKPRLEARRQAMLKMPQLIQEWKQRGHGRGWKKWPK